LGDGGERHGSRLAEHRQVPHIAQDLVFRGDQRPPGVTGQSVEHAVEGQVGAERWGVVIQAGHLPATQIVHHGPQVALLGADLVDSAALLEAEDDLHHQQCRQPTQADQPAAPDRGIR